MTRSGANVDEVANSHGLYHKDCSLHASLTAYLAAALNLLHRASNNIRATSLQGSLVVAITCVVTHSSGHTSFKAKSTRAALLRSVEVSGSAVERLLSAGATSSLGAWIGAAGEFQCRVTGPMLELSASKGYVKRVSIYAFNGVRCQLSHMRTVRDTTLLCFEIRTVASAPPTDQVAKQYVRIVCNCSYVAYA